MISHPLIGPLGHQVLVRLTACLALLVFYGLLRGDPHIGLSTVSTAIRGFCVRWRRLIQMISLIRQLRHATTRRDRRGEQPRSENDAALGLSALELAAVAALNLELARAHDELADDASRRVETRRAAGAKARALRERAESFQLDARRLSAQPMLHTPSMQKPASPRTVPERRTQDRRSASRRRDGKSAVSVIGGRERRTMPERRKRERRCGEPVVR